MHSFLTCLEIARKHKLAKVIFHFTSLHDIWAACLLLITVLGLLDTMLRNAGRHMGWGKELLWNANGRHECNGCLHEAFVLKDGFQFECPYQMTVTWFEQFVTSDSQIL